MEKSFMKTFFKAFLFAVFAAICVPAMVFAAPENHEEFARQYMPESQAIFERFRKECAETRKLRDELAADLRVMNRELDDDEGYCALTEKIAELDRRESAWAAMLKDVFFKHKAAMITAEKLAEDDVALAKKSLAWENGELKTFVKNHTAMFCGIEMVKIPGKPYAFGKYEITQKQYQTVMGKNPSKFKGKNLPVENVSWDDAVEFCRKLTIRERALERISTNQEYRLPTLEEWEYACRAGTTTRFYTGDSEADLARAGWYRGNSGGKTHPVGQKEPNAFGLYDMHGNVREWTWTSTAWYGVKPVCLGGGWRHSDYFCKSSSADSYSPGYRGGDCGFRVVLDPATSQEE